MKNNCQVLLSKQNTNLILRHWQGKKAKLWGYTVSHKVLESRVIDEQRSIEYLTILCGDVETIQGSTMWFNCNFASEKIGDKFILRDVAAGFEVRAGVIGMEEHAS